MNCIRCEIARAKLRAIIYNNMRWPAEQLVNDLNKSQRGVYLIERDHNGSQVYRLNDNNQAPDILIWQFKAN